MENIVQSRYIVWGGAFIMICFALAVLGFIAFYKLRLARIKREECEFLLKATVELENKERHRIALDLHDGICGDLSAIRNYLAILEQSKIDPNGVTIIHNIKESISIVLQNAKEISYNMMPPMIESYGLAAAVEEYARRIQKLNAINILVHCSSKGIDLSNSISYEIYRIIQELVSNTIKYGEATSVQINMEANKNNVCIIISDDGKHFVIKEQLRLSEGIGVKNIYSRINYIGASLTQITKEKGNEVKILIPLHK